MRALGLNSAHLLGHSMGGKTAMLLALTQPALVRSFCVVDIAPVAYKNAVGTEIQAIGRLALEGLTSRADADRQLAESVPQKMVRDFLLTNLLRGEDGNWKWRINVPVLAASFREVTGWPESLGVYDGPALFIKGERSSYILPEYEAATLRQFPQAQLKVVQGAGHWVHSEKPEAVLRLVRNFLLKTG
jgi:esterase